MAYSNTAAQTAAYEFVARVWPVIGPLYLGGQSTGAVAAHLQEQGIPTRRGGPWRASKVWAVIERAHAMGLNPTPARSCAEAQELRREARASNGSFPAPKAGGEFPAAGSRQRKGGVKP
jgi:hypothetical protein